MTVWRSEAIRLRAEGKTYAAIAKTIGKHPESIRIALDPAAREQHRLRVRRNRISRSGVGDLRSRPQPKPGPAPNDVRALAQDLVAGKFTTPEFIRQLRAAYAP